MKRYAARYLYPLTSAHPLENAFVEVDDEGVVLRTGLCEEGEKVLPGALCPGMVNAHCHVELSYMKGLFRKGTGMAGFIDQINALRDTSSLEEKVSALRKAMDGMYAQGVVAMADISNCDDSFAVKAAHSMYTRTFLEVFGADPNGWEAVMEGVKALQQKALSMGLDAAPTPHSCYTMSPALVTASSVEGLRSGFLSFHSEPPRPSRALRPCSISWTAWRPGSPFPWKVTCCWFTSARFRPKVSAQPARPSKSPTSPSVRCLTFSFTIRCRPSA